MHSVERLGRVVNTNISEVVLMTLLRAEEVAERFRVSRAWVYELAKRGELPSVRFGHRAVRFPAEQVEVWLRERMTGAETINS